MGELHYWLVFFGVSFALSIAPGPDLIFILSRTIGQGTKVGLAACAGVCSGATVHVCAAVVGISALLATSATAFSVVKYIGAAYLLYLGIQALRSPGQKFSLDEAKKKARLTTWQAYRQGMLIDVLNPKVAIFFMAFLPQFVRADHGSTSAQLALLGMLVILVDILTEVTLILLAARLSGFFRRHPRASAWLDRSFGTILVGLGVRLATAQRSL